MAVGEGKVIQASMAGWIRDVGQVAPEAASKISGLVRRCHMQPLGTPKHAMPSHEPLYG
jgi:hypothetical protein